MSAFHATDGGRAASRRPRQRNDCVVRACAIATGLPYDQVYNELAALGRRCGRGTDRKAMVGWLKTHATYHAFQAVAGEPRMHLDTFSQTIGATGRPRRGPRHRRHRRRHPRHQPPAPGRLRLLRLEDQRIGRAPLSSGALDKLPRQVVLDREVNKSRCGLVFLLVSWIRPSYLVDK